MLLIISIVFLKNPKKLIFTHVKEDFHYSISAECSYNVSNFAEWFEKLPIFFLHFTENRFILKEFILF